MISSDLVGASARCDGVAVGFVSDLRIELNDEFCAAGLPVVGVVISPRVRSTFLGYERTEMKGPWMVKQLLRFMHRDSFFVDWSDVAGVDAAARILKLRSDFRRRDVALDDDDGR
ncbi:hypothetical protein GOEFS_110_00630 [Gordonia effusa NBRC 100432]|uniref:Uncharacterized protein n=1 Tax=Gordonia effusa NBRC 100432 TaxID=1077974 RepID=H0R5I3_9ACTN|nr:hypothetical protein [Gordonia effusa]GAB20334.1 hypothetical protein GOEFS_110_00630 [Gordonia effusa NBRC 100432]